jgi:nicotinate-nucleotide adenylyltransferase
MKIGIFGGTFDPPHIGHQIVGWHVLQEIGLDRILFVPCATPPHKQDRHVSDGEHRLAMLRFLAKDNPALGVSDAEIRRGGVSFTVETLHEFKRIQPEDQLFFLLGMDNLLDFAAWKQPEEIVRLATLVVMTRPGFPVKRSPGFPEGECIVCEVPAIGVSASMIRNRVGQGKSIRYLVPTLVEDYIHRERLYCLTS